MKNFFIVIGMLTLAGVLHAQFAEDALRYADIGTGPGARARGMGGAYVALADDYSGVFWNPAGLARVEALEFSFGLGVIPYSASTTYLGKQTEMSNTNTRLDALGLIIPIPATRGHLSFALGYHRTNDFNTAFSFDAVNPSNSVITSSALLGEPDKNRNIPYQLFLANYNDSTGKFYSPINGRLRQHGDQQEFEGMNTFALSAAFDAAPNVSIGGTVNFYKGNYDFERRIIESDVNHVYDSYDTTGGTLNNVDLDRFSFYNIVNASIGGIGGTFGVLSTIEDIVSLGLTVRTPTAFSISENFTDSASITRDNHPFGTIAISGRDEYDVVTPWSFAGGAAVTLGSTLISAQLDYVDYSATRFRNENVGLRDENDRIKKETRAVVSYAIGGEYKVRPIGLALRGGFSVRPSQFKEDDASFARKTISFGASVLAGTNMVFDVVYQTAAFNMFHILYSGAERTSEKIHTSAVAMTMAFRF